MVEPATGEATVTIPEPEQVLAETTVVNVWPGAVVVDPATGDVTVLSAMVTVLPAAVLMSPGTVVVLPATVTVDATPTVVVHTPEPGTEPMEVMAPLLGVQLAAVTVS